MFDVGFWELLFIMVLALLVLGPKRLPGVVNKVGGWAGKARYMARSLRVQIERELEADMAATPTRTTPKPAPTPAAKPSGSEAAPASSVPPAWSSMKPRQSSMTLSAPFGSGRPVARWRIR